MRILFPVGSRLLGGGRRARATRFAETRFPGCAVHSQEAAAVHEVLERLGRRALPELDPKATVAEIVAPPTERSSLHGLTLREVVALVVELEAKYGLTTVPRANDFTTDPYGAAVLRAVLGPAAEHSTWTADSIWPRSILSVINERVRWRTGCQCT